MSDKRVWDNKRKVTPQAVMDLYEMFPNTQHFQARSLIWVRSHGAKPLSEREADKRAKARDAAGAAEPSSGDDSPGGDTASP